MKDPEASEDKRKKTSRGSPLSPGKRNGIVRRLVFNLSGGYVRLIFPFTHPRGRKQQVLGRAEEGEIGINTRGGEFSVLGDGVEAAW